MSKQLGLITFTLSAIALGTMLVAYGHSTFATKEQVAELREMVFDIWKYHRLDKQ